MTKIRPKKISSIKALPTKPINLIKKDGSTYIRRQHYRNKDTALIPRSKKTNSSDFDKLSRAKDKLEADNNFESPSNKKRALRLLEKQQTIFEKQNLAELIRDPLSKNESILKNIGGTYTKNENLNSSNDYNLATDTNITTDLDKRTAAANRIIDRTFLKHGYKKLKNKKNLTENEINKLYELSDSDNVDDVAKIGEYIQEGIHAAADTIIKQARDNGYTLKDDLLLMPIQHGNSILSEKFAGRLEEAMKEKGHKVSVNKSISKVKSRENKKGIFNLLDQPDIQIYQPNTSKNSKAIIIQDTIDDGRTLLNTKKLLNNKGIDVVGAHTLTRKNDNDITPNSKVDKLRKDIAVTKGSDILNAVMMKKHGIGLSSMTYKELKTLHSFIQNIKKEKGATKHTATILAAEALRKYNKNNKSVENNDDSDYENIDPTNKNAEKKLIRQALRDFKRGAQHSRIIRKAKRDVRHMFTGKTNKLTPTNDDNDQNDDNRSNNKKVI